MVNMGPWVVSGGHFGASELRANTIRALATADALIQPLNS